MTATRKHKAQPMLKGIDFFMNTVLISLFRSNAQAIYVESGHASWLSAILQIKNRRVS